MRSLRRTLLLLFVAVIAASMVMMAEPKAAVDAQTAPPVPEVTVRFVNDTLIMTFTSPAPVDPSHSFYYRYKEASSDNWTVFYPHNLLAFYPNSIVLGNVDMQGFQIDGGAKFPFGAKLDFQVQTVVKLYEGKYITGGEIYRDLLSGWSSTQTITVPNEPVNKPSPTPTPTAPPLLNVDWSSVDWVRIALVGTVAAVAVLAVVVAVLWRKVVAKASTT